MLGWTEVAALTVDMSLSELPTVRELGQIDKRRLLITTHSPIWRLERSRGCGGAARGLTEGDERPKL
jgi:hypothetical protein